MTFNDLPLQPSLRDRLRNQPAIDARETMRDPTTVRSRRRQLHGEMSELKSSIESSLLMLLMTRQPTSIPDWRRWPHAEASVLNYGVPDLSGFSVSGLAAQSLRRKLKQIIERFEPRLHSGTLDLDVESLVGHPESLMLWVSGNIGPLDAPEAFSIGMSICLVTGHANSLQGRRRAA